MELPDESGALKAVLKVDVPRSLFVHKSPGGYFRRQGSSKREMPPDLLARLFQQRSQARLIRFDEQTVPQANLDDLVLDLWQRFAGPLTRGSQEDLLVKLGMARQDKDGDSADGGRHPYGDKRPAKMDAQCLYSGSGVSR